MLAGRITALNSPSTVRFRRFYCCQAFGMPLPAPTWSGIAHVRRADAIHLHRAMRHATNLQTEGAHAASCRRAAATAGCGRRDCAVHTALGCYSSTFGCTAHSSASQLRTSACGLIIANLASIVRPSSRDSLNLVVVACVRHCHGHIRRQHHSQVCGNAV